MTRKITAALCAILVGTAIGAATSAQAGTIIKLNLGGVGPDIGLNGGGVLSTTDDGDGATTGDQNTAIEFTDFLNGNPDINASIASVSISGLAVAGPAIPGPGILIQSFTGGTVSLYDPANTLLLQGQLGGSTLVGTIGPPGNGGLFSATFGNVTGGTLDPFILNNSLTLQMTLGNINGGAGLVAGPGQPVAPFLADASVTMAADPVPEPTGLLLLVLGGASALVASKRRRQ
jgi:hypothetical protein